MRKDNLLIFLPTECTHSKLSLELTDKKLLDLESVKMFKPQLGQVIVLKLDDGRTIFIGFITKNNEKPTMSTFAQCINIITVHMTDQNIKSLSCDATMP